MMIMTLAIHHCCVVAMIQAILRPMIVANNFENLTWSVSGEFILYDARTKNTKKTNSPTYINPHDAMNARPGGIKSNGKKVLRSVIEIHNLSVAEAIPFNANIMSIPNHKIRLVCCIVIRA